MESYTGECTVRRETGYLQNILWGSASEKRDPCVRFLSQIESSSRPIDKSLAHCTVDVSWKSRSSAQPLSSNVLRTEDDSWITNSASAINDKSDCLLG